MIRAIALRSLMAGLVAILPFAALLCDPSPGWASPILGDAQGFAVLASTAVTNTAAGTTITGDLGVSPAGAVTAAFPPGILTNGSVPHVNDGPANDARAALLAARTGLGGLAPTVTLTGDLGNQTLSPGIYFSAASPALLTGTLLLDAGGLSNQVWVFELSALTTASSSVVHVINTGGFEDQGVFWVIGSSATLGSGSTFEGNILALASITLDPGAQIICGRALAYTAAVTMAGLGGPVPNPAQGRDNAVSIGCEGTEGAEASDTDTSGFSGGLEFDVAGNVSFISGPGPGPGTVPAPASFLLLAAGLIGGAARMRWASAR